MTVPLLSDKGLQYVRASANGKPLLLLDRLGFARHRAGSASGCPYRHRTAGNDRNSGARNTQGAGVAPLDAIDIGAARLPVNAVTVVDLNGLTYDGKAVDGVLGFPLFAAAEIRIDPEKSTADDRAARLATGSRIADSARNESRCVRDRRADQQQGRRTVRR